MQPFGIAGYSGSGKTTLIERLVPTLVARGVSVSLIKHAHHGFDIDTIIFYRGINTPNSEFRMESPDGSSVLGMRFGALSRFSYYFYVYRMLVYGMSRDEWWYDWNRGALPFRMATTRNPRGHYYILDPSKKQWHTEHIPEMLQKLVRD